MTPSQLNSGLAGTGQLRLVSITQPNSLVFVVSVNGAQQVRVNLRVDAHGLIAGLLLQPVESPTSSASDVPALAPGRVAQPVAFAAGGSRSTGPTRIRPRQRPEGLRVRC